MIRWYTGYGLWFFNKSGSDSSSQECVLPCQSSSTQLGSAPSAATFPSGKPSSTAGHTLRPLIRHFCIPTTNCLYSQLLSSRLRRPRTLRSLTAVQFSKSWGESGVGHDPAFTPRACPVARRCCQTPGSTGRETQPVIPRASSPISEDVQP